MELFILMQNFGNYVRNPVKILASYQNFGIVAKISAMLKFGKIFFSSKWIGSSSSFATVKFSVRLRDEKWRKLRKYVKHHESINV